VDQSISDAKQAKTFKEEVVLSSPQGPLVREWCWLARIALLFETLSFATLVHFLLLVQCRQTISSLDCC